MMNRLPLLVAVLRSVRGATAIEYGLIAALVAVAAIVAMKGLGTAIKGTFNNAAMELKAAATPK